MSTASQSTATQGSPRALPVGIQTLPIGMGLAVLTVTCVTSCARGPVLSESAGRLRTDATVVLSRSTHQFGARPSTVTDRTAPCSEGGARRTLHAELPLPTGTPPRVMLDRATALSLEVMGQRGYRLTAPPRGPRRNRTFTMVRTGPEVTLTIRLRGGHHPKLTLDGATSCLPNDM